MQEAGSTKEETTPRNVKAGQFTFAVTTVS